MMTPEWRRLKCRPQNIRRECRAQFSVLTTKKQNHWSVLQFDDVHNHRMAAPDEVPFLWSHRKIKPHQKAQIMTLAAGVIMVHMQ